jgi:D-alanyl-D-alanine carboxypeptidase
MSRLMCVVLSFTFVALSEPVFAAPVPLWGNGPAEKLRKIVESDAAATRVQSVLFGAWIGSAPLFTTAIGDALTGVPATTADHIRAGFVQTEAINQILVSLADHHRVSLDAPLSTWFPGLKQARNVTLRMLGNSRSGYFDYLADTEFQKSFDADPFQTFTADQLIAIAMRHPLVFRPGTGFHYAHTNAVLLGAALQKITGESVPALMQRCIFTPLHLNQSIIPDSADVPVPVQHVFSRDRGFFEDTTYFNPSWAINSGTIVTTIGDVAVMQRAFGSGALLSKAGLAEILAPTNVGTPPFTKDFYFALGVLVGNTWVLNRASVAGSDVIMAYLPKRDLTIVVSTAYSAASTPSAKGPGVRFLKDAADLLAPERPIPHLFTGL